MADINRGGEAGTQCCSGERPNTVDQQAGAGGVAITSRICAFEVLERSDHIEKPHWHDHPEPWEEVGSVVPKDLQLKRRWMPADGADALLPGAWTGSDQTATPGENHAQKNGHQACG